MGHAPTLGIIGEHNTMPPGGVCGSAFRRPGPVIRTGRLKAELQTLELMVMNFRRKQRRDAQPSRFEKAESSRRERRRRDATPLGLSYNARVRLLIQVKRWPNRTIHRENHLRAGRVGFGIESCSP